MYLSFSFRRFHFFLLDVTVVANTQQQTIYHEVFSYIADSYCSNIIIKEKARESLKQH